MKGLLNLSNPEPGMVSYKCKPMKPVLCYWVFGDYDPQTSLAIKHGSRLVFDKVWRGK